MITWIFNLNILSPPTYTKDEIDGIVLSEEEYNQIVRDKPYYKVCLSDEYQGLLKRASKEPINCKWFIGK